MKVQNYLTIALCSLFVLFFSFLCIFTRTPDYSDAERRALAKFPEVSWQSISTGEFATAFEEYTTDRFPFRDNWRSIKAYSRLNLFLQKENNGIFIKDGHIGKTEYPMNTQMLDYAASLFSRLKDRHFKNNNVYLSVIPDKNKYIADLKYDYGALEDYIQEKLPFCTPIELGTLLSADDYYYTDSHWRQDKITDVAGHIAGSMGVSIPTEYEKVTLDTDFYGVYAGQSALNCKPDKITYLTNNVIGGLKVSGADAVYDFNKANGKDPYEFFLSGNQPLIKISNPSCDNQKRLVIFRDSFASSVTPLLAQGYSQVWMVDLRYMNSALIDNYVDFTDADVLLLYSASVLNSATSMR